jgi:hypothetical protein
MRDKAGGQAVSQRERCDQRAELVTHLARQQSSGELESVKDLGAFLPAEMALQHADIDVRVVCNQNVGIKRLSNFAFDVSRGWRCLAAAEASGRFCPVCPGSWAIPAVA